MKAFAVQKNTLGMTERSLHCSAACWATHAGFEFLCHGVGAISQSHGVSLHNYQVLNSHTCVCVCVLRHRGRGCCPQRDKHEKGFAVGWIKLEFWVKQPSFLPVAEGDAVIRWLILGQYRDNCCGCVLTGAFVCLLGCEWNCREGDLWSHFPWEWAMCPLPSQSCVPTGALGAGAACATAWLLGASRSSLGIGTVERRVGFQCHGQLARQAGVRTSSSIVCWLSPLSQSYLWHSRTWK